MNICSVDDIFCVCFKLNTFLLSYFQDLFTTMMNNTLRDVEIAVKSERMRDDT